jgi:tripartite-type tricarboxylate transporter receptor subunit TctC
MYRQTRKGVLFSIILLSGLFWVVSSLQAAQPFPSQPITLVIPKEAGGTHDQTARAVTSISKAVLGQPVVILLKPGGGGAIASDYVAKADPDGYTLLYGDNGGNSALPALMGRSKGPDDLLAVCQLGVNNSLAVARADAPYKNFKEMVAYAKANPNVVKYATPGALSNREIEWKELLAEMGIKTKIIPYDGGNPAITAVLGGHADITTAAIPTSGPHIKAGKMVGLYIIAAKRDSEFPNIPTSKEVGISGYSPMWRTVFAPKGTPRPVIDALAAGFKKMLDDKNVQAMLEKIGDDPTYVGPDEFAKYWRAEYEMYKKYRPSK